MNRKKSTKVLRRQADLRAIIKAIEIGHESGRDKVGRGMFVWVTTADEQGRNRLKNN